ncbi:MAG: hypothetical protein M1830_008644 [Pleopsidium flavum]|nr:MAG: hypothetical protein M1830_008644 [Pleopsidium flavum]
MEATRNQAFQKLKPPCVELNQVALRFKTKSATSKDVLRALETLHRVLLDVSHDENALDEKLADYVFFPLSHIFRESQELPLRVLELALQCLRILLESAWRHKLSASLGIQLLILLSFIAGRSPTQVKSKETSEELTLVVFECLHSLFNGLIRSVEGKQSLTEATNIPALGHTVTVLLDGVTDGISDQNQLAAVAALDALISCLGDREAIASFFPGMVSSLTKALQASTRSKRSRKFLEAGIDVLSKLIRMVISDGAVAELHEQSTAVGKRASSDIQRFGSSWAKATAAQVKLALANVVRLRNHDRAEIRQVLHRLCLTVLENCRESLSESTAMMVETLITLSATDQTQEDVHGVSGLNRLAFMDSSIVGIIKGSLHSWTLSLPRIMQSNDDSAKTRIIGQISTSIKVLSDLQSQTNTLDYDVATSLRDSVVAITHAHTSSKQRQTQPNGSLQLLPADGQEASTTFRPILVSQRGEQETLLALSSMVRQLSGSTNSLAMTRIMLDEARASTGKTLLANFWLALNFLRSMSATNHDMDLFLASDPPKSGSHENLLEELYSLSLTILSENNEEDVTDWRLQGLALEAVALQSSQLGQQFRPELVDALYPIVQLMGSPQADLRDHAITCLNMVSGSCGYPNTSDLIIDNVDYLVNSVALKLNTFDISPQAPQVLLMMIRLCGSSLLPYLDDLVGSVFAALDSFHGYPRLVELLFAVLGAIVAEGSKSASPSITAGNQINHRKQPWRPRTVSDVARQLKEAKAKTTVTLDNDLSQAPDPDPQTDPLPSDSPAEEPQPSTSDESPAATPSKIYTLISSITLLTRHYLPHTSAPLRNQLLHLLTTAFPLLSHNETLFLPLINSLWPVLIKRLYDTEPFVCVAAAEAVAKVCECAGDFMASRIESEWDDIKSLFWRVHGRIRAENKGKGKGRGRGRGVYSTNYQMWDALVKMLVVIVGYVRIGDEMFDDVVEMVADCLGSRREVREALEGVNPDAVWLEMERQGANGVSLGDLPKVDGFVFKAVEL